MTESPIKPCGTYSWHCALKGRILRLCTVQPKSLLRNHKYVLFIRINILVVLSDFERGSSGQSNSFVTLWTLNNCTVNMFNCSLMQLAVFMYIRFIGVERLIKKRFLIYSYCLLPEVVVEGCGTSGSYSENRDCRFCLAHLLLWQIFSDSPQYFHTRAGIHLQIGYGRFLSRYFQFIIYKS
jgi:hypothetical protein